MLRLLLRRLAGTVVVLTVVSFLTFALLDLAPGDAADTLVGEYASTVQLATVRHELGLDAPLVSRYLRFISAAILHGDLGCSLISGRQVSKLIFERFGNTVTLALAAISLALAVGTLTGIAAAARPGGHLDLAVMSITTLGLSLPTFWVALLLIMAFSLRLGWLPVVGAGGPVHLVLPTVCLAFPTTAVVARLMRASLLDVKSADYVRTAHAKGLARHQVWRDHILRNGLIPVITLLGLHLGRLLGGTFIIETIFGWPGLGRLVVHAILDRDFPVVLGAVLLMAIIYQVLNFVVDIAHAGLDPQVGRGAL
jgi:ABC-type dipeptide/oligopeptide/nickel transport system permease component